MKKIFYCAMPLIAYWLFCWAVTAAVLAEFISPASFMVNWIEYDPADRGVFMALHSIGLFFAYIYSWHKGFFEYD